MNNPPIPTPFHRRSLGLKSTHPHSFGFTLIEVIAVLGILSIVAALFATNLVGRLKRATRDSEAASMASITDALRARILRTQEFPDASTIPQAIADELSLPLSRVQATLAGVSRSYLIDPDLQIGSPTSAVRTLPYRQGVRGSIQPVSPRFIVISSLASTIPITNSPSSQTFTSLWANVAGSVPSSWTSWKGESEDLRFARLDFRNLFHRVVFNNLDPTNTATYSIGSPTNSLGLTVGQRAETWFLATSALNLHFPNGSIQTREFVRADTSFVFENGRWSRDVTYGVQPPLGPFGLLVQDFLDSPVPDDSRFGATPQAVVEEFFTYMFTYGVWATGQLPDILPFETGGSTSEQQIPQYRVLKESQARMDSIIANLTH